MARKKKEAAEDKPEVRPGRSIWPYLRFITFTMVTALALLGVAFAAYETQQAVLSDPRFKFAPGEAPTEEYIALSGIHNSSKTAILRVFAGDRDHSIAQVNIEERRRTLRQVPWVKDAMVRRVWPNHLAVDVVERTPVAFVELPKGATGSFDEPVSYTSALIDGDGVILHPRVPMQLDLPLLSGVRENDRLEVRRDRARRMTRLIDDLASYRKNIQEVDLADPNNLRISYQIDGKQIVLILGEERYRERLELFLKNYPGIQDKVLPGGVLDVSLEGRVIVH